MCLKYLYRRHELPFENDRNPRIESVPTQQRSGSNPPPQRESARGDQQKIASDGEYENHDNDFRQWSDEHGGRGSRSRGRGPRAPRGHDMPPRMTRRDDDNNG